MVGEGGAGVNVGGEVMGRPGSRVSVIWGIGLISVILSSFVVLQPLRRISRIEIQMNNIFDFREYSGMI